MEKNNKLINRAYDRYLHGTTYDNIYKAYNKPSSKKIDAWEYCKSKCSEYNGMGLRIIGRNRYTFSAGFIYEDKEGKWFYFITKHNDWRVEI